MGGGNCLLQSGDSPVRGARGDLLSDKRRKKESRAEHPEVSRSGSVPVEVRAVLASALRQTGLEERIARYNFMLRWPEIVGEEIARRTRPEYIRGRCLIVRVVDSVWAQELSFHKQAILVRLRRHMEEGEMLDDVAFVVGEM